MAEPRRVTGTSPYQDPRSPMALAAAGAPFKAYVWNGEREEPPAVVAARERARAIEDHIARLQAEADARLTARIDAMRQEESAPDIGPGPEWYRELAAEAAEDAADLAEAAEDAADLAEPAAPPLVLVPDPVPVPVTAPVPAPPAAPSRCRRCGYPPGAVGHQVTCGGRSAAEPVPAPPATRCGQCGYLTSTIGHKVACDG